MTPFKMITVPIIGLMCLGHAVTTSASAEARADIETLSCAGCKTEYLLFSDLAKVSSKQKVVNLKPAKTGNKKAIELFKDGKVDFAFTCKSHWALAKKFKIDSKIADQWVSVAVARDPIIVIANKDSGVTGLSSDQVKGIFSGEITNWKDAGGNDLPIAAAYLKDTVESGVLTVFKETTVGKDGTLVPAAKELDLPTALGHFCSSKSGGVTFMALGSYKAEYGTAVEIDGIAPTVKNVVGNKYPIAVTYHVVYRKADADQTAALLDFMGTKEGLAVTNDRMVAIPHAVVEKPKKKE
jgi:ABC-type phosphate transport system substrate-binding protein